jgi:hypothetical protein
MVGFRISIESLLLARTRRPSSCCLCRCLGKMDKVKERFNLRHHVLKVTIHSFATHLERLVRDIVIIRFRSSEQQGKPNLVAVANYMIRRSGVYQKSGGTA